MIKEIGGPIHNLLHKHLYLSRDLERMVICSQRWPRGKTAIYYQPHAHHPWKKLTVEDFQGRLMEGGELSGVWEEHR